MRPNITHGAAGEDLQNGILPLVTTYKCDATTGDANNSANTYCRLQWVYNPAYGLINHIMQIYQDTWNTTRGMPIEERMDYAMATSYSMKAIVRHHLYMKTGSGCDRTFPDCVLTFAFARGKIDIQKSEIESMTDEEKTTSYAGQGLANHFRLPGNSSRAFQAHHQRDAPDWPT